MLTDEQRQKLTVEAQKRGINPSDLIAAAEVPEVASSEAEPAAKGGKVSAPSKDGPPLYMYHLPFVTVNEVRTRWLGLEPLATGGDEMAATFAAKSAAAFAPAKPSSEPPK